jgi:hypothetical protein
MVGMASLIIFPPGDGFMIRTVATFPYSIRAAGIGAGMFGFERHGKDSFLDGHEGKTGEERLPIYIHFIFLSVIFWCSRNAISG